MRKADWVPLISTLDRWRAEGRVARLWLRDDDAVEPTPALARLMDLCDRHHVPTTLAVIPAHAGEALAAFLRGRDSVEVALHGWSHENHAPPDKKKQELGPHRAADVVLDELARGVQRLGALFGTQFVPVLVPPWNRIDTMLLPRLSDIGVTGLSVFGPEKASALPIVNTHADIMDWHGTRGCRPTADIVADIIKRLGEMEGSGGTMGLLTHHLVHDEAAWTFIDEILAATAGHPACRWCGLGELIDAP
jgi:peptidoglycan/xylan/chitin deacetylase (PgdA/CDA1 family)